MEAIVTKQGDFLLTVCLYLKVRQISRLRTVSKTLRNVIDADIENKNLSRLWLNFNAPEVEITNPYEVFTLRLRFDKTVKNINGEHLLSIFSQVVEAKIAPYEKCCEALLLTEKSEKKLMKIVSEIETITIPNALRCGCENFACFLGNILNQTIVSGQIGYGDIDFDDIIEATINYSSLIFFSFLVYQELIDRTNYTHIFVQVLIRHGLETLYEFEEAGQVYIPDFVEGLILNSNVSGKTIVKYLEHQGEILSFNDIQLCLDREKYFYLADACEGFTVEQSDSLGENYFAYMRFKDIIPSTYNIMNAGEDLLFGDFLYDDPECDDTTKAACILYMERNYSNGYLEKVITLSKSGVVFWMSKTTRMSDVLKLATEGFINAKSFFEHYSGYLAKTNLEILRSVFTPEDFEANEAAITKNVLRYKKEGKSIDHLLSFTNCEMMVGKKPAVVIVMEAKSDLGVRKFEKLSKEWKESAIDFLIKADSASKLSKLEKAGCLTLDSKFFDRLLKESACKSIVKLYPISNMTPEIRNAVKEAAKKNKDTDSYYTLRKWDK